MQNSIQHIEDYLQDRRNNLVVFDADTHKRLGNRVNILDINKDYNSIEEYLKSFAVSKSTKKIAVQLYKKNGTSNTKDGDTIDFEFAPRTTQLGLIDETVTSVANAPASVAPPVSTPTPPVYQPHGLNAPFGMNAVDFINLKTDQEKLRLSVEQIEVLKRKNLALETDNKNLLVENNKLSATNLLADERLQLALDKKDNETKPLLSDSATSALTEIAKSLAPLLIKTPVPTGMNAAQEEQISAAKKSAINFIKSSSVTDEIANNIVSIIYAIQSDKDTAETVNMAMQEFQQKQN